jgi:hypothetical protein
MFSPNAGESTRLIDNMFIAGVNYENVKKFVSSSSLIIKPDILMSFPENKELITNSILDFVFPNGINVSYSEENDKFYTIILTNEKGVRSYIYILKTYERIPLNELLNDENNDGVQISGEGEKNRLRQMRKKTMENTK